MNSPSESFEVRKAAFTDLSEIVRLLADDNLGATREQWKDPLPSAYVNAFHRIQDDSNQDLMVVVDGDKVIGTFQLSYLQYLTYTGGLRVQVEAVRIDKDYRGLGVGKWMMEWIIEQARTMKAHVVQLTSTKSRESAIEFYEKLGFEATHEGMKYHLR